mmetsp:Transcript_93977/g.289815  ORF Transcript_93977/g.289815 Transcript_93977/m.289815 type:complete len:938 (+) Transcript_93977:42-2855(+)
MLRARPLLSVVVFVASVTAEYALQKGCSDEAGGWHGILAHVAGCEEDGAIVDSPVVAHLQLDAVVETPTRLHITIDDANKSRSRVPEAVLSPPVSTSFADCSSVAGGCKVRFLPRWGVPFSFAAVRVDSRGVGVLFDSQAAPLVYKDQYVSVATALPPGAQVFGLMESSRRKLAMQPGETRTMWSADTPATMFDVNLYGAHPFFVILSPDGTAHGVLMLNSHGMDVTLSDDVSRLHHRLVGGMINLYMFSGPTVSNVVAQYTEVVGRPAMMPRWSLGFHNCRWGYRNVGELEAVSANYTAAEIPITTFWVDIDYMDGFRDFTTNPAAFPASRLKAYVDRLHAKDQRFVLILDPGIKIDPNDRAYEEGLAEGIFVQDGFTRAPYTGVVWPGAVHYPDFLHPNASVWWTRQIESFHRKVPVDGLWVDMNEVSNFCNADGRNQECHLANASEAPTCFMTGDGQPRDALKEHCCRGTDGRVVICREVDPGNPLDFPPYRIRNKQSGLRPMGAKTLPPSALHHGGAREYDVHSTYGTLMAKATAQALSVVRPGTRPFVLSRSTFVGHGAYAAHWLGDNAARWEELRASITGMLSFSLLGVPMVGADICGFVGDTEPELCSRWIQVGAFAPLSRVHNSKGNRPQELYRWSSVARSARAALGLRYRLLPYLYTLFYEAHTTGSMVARPLFAVFPGDVGALAAAESQFMLGDAVLVTPVLEPSKEVVRGYFPKGRWYSLVDGQPSVDASTGGRWVDLQTPLDRTNVHARGGKVLPMQREANTTSAMALDVLVPLDEEGQAAGRVFLDDGEQPIVGRGAVVMDVQVACPALDCAHFSGLTLRSTGGPSVTSWAAPRIRSIRVLGVRPPPPGWAFSFRLGGSPQAPAAAYDEGNATIAFEDLDLEAAGFHSLLWRAVPQAVAGTAKDASSGGLRRLRQAAGAGLQFI